MPSVKGFSKSKEHLSPKQKFLSELILKEKLLKLCPKAMLYLSVQRTF